MLHKIYHDYIFRVANLRDGLSTHMANVHLGLISANEHYELDPLSGILVRRIRSPQSLRPHLTVLVDDFYRAYTHGISTTDFSYDEGAPGRKFRCKVILLFWTGDYPAQALVSGTHSKTCHWCTLKSTAAPEITRRCWGDYRCYLPDSHPMRRDATYGRPETRPPPPSRTHEDFFTHGRAQEEYKGPEVRSPYKESGIKEASILAALPLFNIAWDILGDMMRKEQMYQVIRLRQKGQSEDLLGTLEVPVDELEARARERRIYNVTDFCKGPSFQEAGYFFDKNRGLISRSAFIAA